MPERAQRVKALLQQAVALLEREGELLAAAEIDFPALERSLQQMGAIMQELEACRPCRSAPALAPGEAAPFAVSRDENKLDLDSAEPASPAELSSLAERIIALRRRNMDLLRARMSECAARIKEAAHGKEVAAAYRGAAGLLEEQPPDSGSSAEAAPAKFLEKLR